MAAHKQAAFEGRLPHQSSKSTGCAPAYHRPSGALQREMGERAPLQACSAGSGRRQSRRLESGDTSWAARAAARRERNFMVAYLTKGVGER